MVDQIDCGREIVKLQLLILHFQRQHHSNHNNLYKKVDTIHGNCLPVLTAQSRGTCPIIAGETYYLIVLND